MEPGARILVVDDDPDTQVYLEALLEDHGYVVDTSSSAGHALDSLDDRLVDAVILDVMMPGRSGLDLLVRLRGDPRYADLPLVMLTGNDAVVADGGRTYARSHGAVRGADAVLGKPVEPTELLRVLGRLLGR